ncbi:acid phosphatase det1 [Actinomortierella wolfii]|nr:acid phosphatase det1 [Actinomortierella wolfii]
MFYLIGISKNQQAVHIFDFKGSGGPSEEKSPDTLGFKDYFELRHETHVARESEMLSKDFCLVTDNGRFIIVAATAPCTTSSTDARPYPCSLNCIPHLDLVVLYVIELKTGKVVDRREFKSEYVSIALHAGVSLYGSLLAVMLIQSQAIQIIHIKDNGKLVDLHRIGWYNHDDDELVLARYREFNEQFNMQQSLSATVPYYSRGCYESKEDDPLDIKSSERLDSFALAPSMSSTMDSRADLTYHQVPSGMPGSSSRTAPSGGATAATSATNTAATATTATTPSYSYTHCCETNSQMISGIKQRLLSFLFRKAYNADDGGAALRHFHLTFQQFASLVMWRMQFLDNEHMLIKFGKTECVLGRPSDSTYQTAFFVIYNFCTTEIAAVYDNASEEFIQIYEAWADQFSASAYTTAGPNKQHYTSTCSNNIYAKDLLKKYQYSMRHARNGGLAQAIKRTLNVLPFHPQSLSDSPYFDLALFSYDDKVISNSDRPKPCQDFPIKFYLRGSGELKFKIDVFKPGPSGTGNGTNTNVVRKRFATFITHPFEPFMISIVTHQHQPALPNFHVRIPRSSSDDHGKDALVPPPPPLPLITENTVIAQQQQPASLPLATAPTTTSIPQPMDGVNYSYPSRPLQQTPLSSRMQAQSIQPTIHYPSPPLFRHPHPIHNHPNHPYHHHYHHHHHGLRHQRSYQQRGHPLLHHHHLHPYNLSSSDRNGDRTSPMTRTISSHASHFTSSSATSSVSTGSSVDEGTSSLSTFANVAIAAAAAAAATATSGSSSVGSSSSSSLSGMFASEGSSIGGSGASVVVGPSGGPIRLRERRRITACSPLGTYSTTAASLAGGRSSSSSGVGGGEGGGGGGGLSSASGSDTSMSTESSAQPTPQPSPRSSPGP